MSVKFKNCGCAHASWDCSKPKKSTAARKDVQDHASCVGATSRKDTGTAGTQALPVDTLTKPKIGRPCTGFNKKEYNRKFTSDLRALRRLGLNCTVKEYRAMKETRND